jgi:hypothetical protein
VENKTEVAKSMFGTYAAMNVKMEQDILSQYHRYIFLASSQCPGCLGSPRSFLVSGLCLGKMIDLGLRTRLDVILI